MQNRILGQRISDNARKVFGIVFLIARSSLLLWKSTKEGYSLSHTARLKLGALACLLSWPIITIKPVFLTYVNIGARSHDLEITRSETTQP